MLARHSRFIGIRPTPQLRPPLLEHYDPPPKIVVPERCIRDGTLADLSAILSVWSPAIIPTGPQVHQYPEISSLSSKCAREGNGLAAGKLT